MYVQWCSALLFLCAIVGFGARFRCTTPFKLSLYHRNSTNSTPGRAHVGLCFTQEDASTNTPFMPSLYHRNSTNSTLGWAHMGLFRSRGLIPAPWHERRPPVPVRQERYPLPEWAMQPLYLPLWTPAPVARSVSYFYVLRWDDSQMSPCTIGNQHFREKFLHAVWQFLVHCSVLHFCRFFKRSIVLDFAVWERAFLC